MRVKTLTTVFVLIMSLQLLLRPISSYALLSFEPFQVSAIILDKGNCSFNTPGPYPIIFDPALNPLSAIDRSQSVTFSVKCAGNKDHTVIIDRVGTSQLYLANGLDVIPFSLNLPTSVSGVNKTPVPVTVTAAILGSDYRNAPAGKYTASITINVLP